MDLLSDRFLPPGLERTNEVFQTQVYFLDMYRRCGFIPLLFQLGVVRLQEKIHADERYDGQCHQPAHDVYH